MQAAAYFKAAIPEPFTILGLRLKPFSLGHYIILSRFNCAFVSVTESVATMDDLVFGVLVCSMEYDEFLEFAESDDFLEKVKLWGEKVGIFDRKEKAGMFKQYLEQGLKQPRFWIEQEQERESGSHWAQAVLTTLTGSLGYSQHDALNRPLAQSLSDFYKHAENNGVIRFMTESEIAEIEALEALAKPGAANGS